MFRCIASTTAAIYDEIRAAIRESVLVVLLPGQVVQQHCTMVLITVRGRGLRGDLRWNALLDTRLEKLSEFHENLKEHSKTL